MGKKWEKFDVSVGIVIESRWRFCTSCDCGIVIEVKVICTIVKYLIIMSSQDINMLIEMGFPRNKVERALEVTGNQGVEPAMEWLLAHADEALLPVPTAPSETLNITSQGVTGLVTEENDGNEGAKNETDQPQRETESQSTTTDSAIAKSLKCDECGRLFRSQLEVEFHAGKSGHSSFSESTEEKKPLTEEQKKEQLKKLEEKMKQKRFEREEAEKKEALEREKLRIRSGKEMVAAKKKLEEDEMKKLVEQRKREKLEEKLARQRVKEQIEQDKIARRVKFGKGPIGDETKAAVLAESSQLQQAHVSQPARDYSQTRLQIRLTNGQALTQTFGSKEQLSAVRLYIEMNRTDGSGPFSLMTSFPKKIFTDDDYEKPLDLLGLVPSAVVIVSRAQ
ncbi:UBX domain-containing protein 1 isoform X4 [Periplaneta americana]|uniref:UBX domain-containing protein 1 isoform X4 n=1 Tax=Periplaneta americana TaxID=6978 RepID=UPI0037E75429